MNERVMKKLTILSDAAKYDVSCASSGIKRKNQNGTTHFNKGNDTKQKKLNKTTMPNQNSKFGTNQK